MGQGGRDLVVDVDAAGLGVDLVLLLQPRLLGLLPLRVALPDLRDPRVRNERCGWGGGSEAGGTLIWEGMKITGVKQGEEGGDVPESRMPCTLKTDTHAYISKDIPFYSEGENGWKRLTMETLERLQYCFLLASGARSRAPGSANGGLTKPRLPWRYFRFWDQCRGTGTAGGWGGAAGSGVWGWEPNVTPGEAL